MSKENFIIIHSGCKQYTREKHNRQQNKQHHRKLWNKYSYNVHTGSINSDFFFFFRYKYARINLCLIVCTLLSRHNRHPRKQSYFCWMRSLIFTVVLYCSFAFFIHFHCFCCSDIVLLYFFSLCAVFADLLLFLQLFGVEFVKYAARAKTSL